MLHFTRAALVGAFLLEDRIGVRTTHLLLHFPDRLVDLAAHFVLVAGSHFVDTSARRPSQESSLRRARCIRWRSHEAHSLPCCSNDRSEERRVGKEWRSRWSPYH